MIDGSKIQSLFDNQESSQFLRDLEKLDIDPLQECCKKFICRLEKNVYVICIESMQFYSVWLKERQFRITGSVAYGIFTYRNNKNPNWEKKSMNYFYPKALSNCYVKHGIDNEILARKAFAKTVLPLKIVETGLIVSHKNPWLGYSPDGIIYDEDKPVKSIEIKCPYAGKTQNLSEVIKSIKWLVVKDGRFTVNESHTYFAQVQIGMAVLNLPVTEFIVYAPFDNEFISFPIEFQPAYATKLLHSLKKLYFNKMVHYACQTENKHVEE